MGTFYSRLFEREARILLLGLDAAGKTTILYKLKLDEVVSTIPTIGFNVETIRHNKFVLTVWDVGGQDKIRSLWKHYFQNTDVVLFAVDAADTTRFAEASQELFKIMSHENMRGCKGLVVLANKSDMADAKPAAEIARVLDVERYRVPYHVQATCAIRGEGIVEAIKRVEQMLSAGARKDVR